MANDTHHPRVVLVTGGAGFIGCNLVRHLLAGNETLRVINLDALTYAGSLTNLQGVEQTYADRYRFVHADICDGAAVGEVLRGETVDTIIHLAAESHVDRSITGPAAFLQTNVMGTYALLEAARDVWASREDVRFHHVSTDEVFGSLGAGGLFTEETAWMR